ncbi:hypothetical protein LCGC14_2575420 [marine sediment metagenome]|uniref:Uncharacterized protein n=1 Tax=marine sediment metagenome TaxID=412755 RepID=A0A0F9D8R9_9ZZZZ
MVRTMRQQIIDDKFDYFVKKVKLPTMLTIVQLGKLWPKPKWNNLDQPSSQILLEAMEQYVKFERIEGIRKDMMMTAFRVIIAVYDHDSFYRHRLRWLIKLLTTATSTVRWNMDEEAVPTPHLWDGPDQN